MPRATQESKGGRSRVLVSGLMGIPLVLKLKAGLCFGLYSAREQRESISSVQSLSCVQLFATLRIAVRQASLSITTPGDFSNPCPSSQWCHPNISSSVVPFYSHLHSFTTSGTFPMSQLFASGGQSIRASASASVLPVNIQDWFPLVWTGLIFFLSKELSRVFSNTTAQKHQFFMFQILHP